MLSNIWCFLNIKTITEDNYKKHFEELVQPYFKTGQSDFFKNNDNLSLYFHKITNNKNKRALVILPGRTEPLEKYQEVVYDLKDIEHDIFLLDLRGQGNSQREVDDPHKGYVENYKNYGKDIDLFIKEIVKPSRYEEVNFLGHSMGAAVGLLHATENPNLFSKMVLSAPMVEINTNDKPQSLVYSLFRTMRLLGMGKNYVPGGDRGNVNFSFEKNRVTSSLARFNMARDLERKNPFYVMGSSTVSWVIEAIEMGNKVFRNKEKLNGIKLLMFQGGKDLLSYAKRQRQICKANDCELVYFEESKHEMFQEVNEIRDIVINKSYSFLKS